MGLSETVVAKSLSTGSATSFAEAKKTVHGKTYDAEVFDMTLDGKPVEMTYCYDGGALRYLITRVGGKQASLEYLSVSDKVDESLLKLPEGYTVCTKGTDGNWGKFATVVGVLLVIMILVVYVELSQRRIPVQYTRRMIGRKMYGGSSTYLPLKINMSGVIPPIFASSILAIPTLIAQFGNSDQSWVKWINSNLANTTSVWYIALYALMIVFFCFFYTEITFNPDETADNMKQYGGFIPGIRAGSATSRYLNYVMNRLNTVGAVYLLFVALIPTVLIMALNLNTKLPFGGTTILIIAGVGLDTLRQAKAQTEQFQYAGFLFEGTDHQEGK